MKIWKWKHVQHQALNGASVRTGKGDRSREYLADFGTFDTEFTTVKYTEEDKEHGKGLIYLWTACIQGTTYEGRSVEEFVKLVSNMRSRMGLNRKKIFVFYVHNLSADFPYIFPFFTWDDVFASNKRSVLKATTADGIEFRCSYKLSNMSLAKFLKAEGVQHQKQSGEKYGYEKLRTPDTDLTAYERYYAACDVLGLYEAIKAKMEKDGDDIATIPMTSTGYVRRDCRMACAADKNYRFGFRDGILTLDQYDMLIDAFRGGNTHANREYSGRTLENIWSYDISSSYPSVMLYENYPRGGFQRIDIESEDDADALIDRGYGLLMEIRFLNLRTDDPIPYLSVSKCVFDIGAIDYDDASVHDNGRVLFDAGWTTTTVTNVDYEIIRDRYEYDDIEFVKCYKCKMGPLPLPLRQTISRYFEDKTTLKNVEGQEYFYTKAKNKLNGIYGMCVMALVRDSYLVDQATGAWSVETPEDRDGALKKYYDSRQNFLHYQWGVWVTAYARKRLQEAIDICGNYIVYCDTDSVKFRYHPEIVKAIEGLNRKYQQMADNCETTATAVTKDGELQTLGLWDLDAKYDRFKTYGAKKYAFEKGGKFKFTVSGLGKAAESELKSLEDFTLGRTIVNSGRTISEYDDDPTPHYIKVNGKKWEIRSNMAILNTTYTLGVTDEYLDLVEALREDYERVTIDGKKTLRFRSSTEWDPE